MLTTLPPLGSTYSVGHSSKVPSDAFFLNGGNAPQEDLLEGAVWHAPRYGREGIRLAKMGAKGGAYSHRSSIMGPPGGFETGHLLGARPKVEGARRKSAPQMMSENCEERGALLNVSGCDGLAPLPYIPGGHSLGCSPVISPWGSPRGSPRGGSPRISPRGSPRASPRASPRSSPRKRSRALSRDIQLEELVVVSVPCRERKIESVRLLDRFNSRKPSTGTLYLTATHLIFVDPDAKKETWILHMHIASVEKQPLSTQGSPLHVRCKTFLSVTFIIPKERDCHDLYVSLIQLSQPASLEDLYCFHYTASSEELNKKTGWDVYDPIKEFQRMGVPNASWVDTKLNNNYEICDTYPQELFVPSEAPTKVILSSSRFRSKGRFPVLTYLHKNQAALCRCSQPLSGFSARCLEDEQLMNCILRCNPSSSHMLVVDTRPKINAMANRAAGKGYENEAFYENIKFHFSGIENIHVMRSSLTKLIETCQLVTPSMASFLGGVESSGWLRHVRCVLETSFCIASSLASSVSVLVHCSDGWDRTAQTCALAQVLLDPFYRTLHGFQVLIEKEWLSFGHKFTDRCGHIQGDTKEISPIFTQFVDCVWQLMQILPCAFEFNERFLLVLHDHVYSAQFGTFIGNCQKDRVDLRLSERTYSFWGYVKNHETEYRNPLYRKDSTPDVMKPNLLPHSIKFWRGMYNRFENGVHPREPVGDILAATLEHSISLEDHIEFLTKRISWLKEEIRKRKESKVDNKTQKIGFDNRLINDKILQNGDIYKSGVNTGVMSMRQVEESLVSAGALPLTPNNQQLSPSQDKPSLTETSPEKLTIEIKDVDNYPVNGINAHQITTTTCSVISPIMSSLALDWKSFRHIRECSCSTPFDHFSRKYHCWRCGDVFCTRCIDKKTSLPGHVSRDHVPVCRPCYKEVTRSLSVDTP